MRKNLETNLFFPFFYIIYWNSSFFSKEKKHIPMTLAIRLLTLITIVADAPSFLFHYHQVASRQRTEKIILSSFMYAYSVKHMTCSYFPVTHTWFVLRHYCMTINGSVFSRFLIALQYSNILYILCKNKSQWNNPKLIQHFVQIIVDSTVHHNLKACVQNVIVNKLIVHIMLVKRIHLPVCFNSFLKIK